jgi:hypothetical protein
MQHRVAIARFDCIDIGPLRDQFLNNLHVAIGCCIMKRCSIACLSTNSSTHCHHRQPDLSCSLSLSLSLSVSLSPTLWHQYLGSTSVTYWNSNFNSARRPFMHAQCNAVYPSSFRECGSAPIDNKYAKHSNRPLRVVI